MNPTQNHQKRLKLIRTIPW